MPDETVLDAWRIAARATSFLVENLPQEIWNEALPGAPRKTVRSIAAHLHNGRCGWLKSMAGGTKLAIPRRVDPRKVTRRQLLTALRASGEAMRTFLEAGQANGGRFPGLSSAFYWGAMPRDVTLFTAYAVSHEAHHRGQLVLMARLLGHRLPPKVWGGLWQWSARLKEARK